MCERFLEEIVSRGSTSTSATREFIALAQVCTWSVSAAAATATQHIWLCTSGTCSRRLHRHNHPCPLATLVAPLRRRRLCCVLSAAPAALVRTADPPAGLICPHPCSCRSFHRLLAMGSGCLSCAAVKAKRRRPLVLVNLSWQSGAVDSRIVRHLAAGLLAGGAMPPPDLQHQRRRRCSSCFLLPLGRRRCRRADHHWRIVNILPGDYGVARCWRPDGSLRAASAHLMSHGPQLAALTSMQRAGGLFISVRRHLHPISRPGPPVPRERVRTEAP